MRISDWSSDVCSSDLYRHRPRPRPASWQSRRRMPSAGGSWPRPSALEPCFVALGCVGARLVAGGQTVVTVPPVLRRYISRIDVQRLPGLVRVEQARPEELRVGTECVSAGRARGT